MTQTNGASVNEAREAYLQAWSEMMVRIWQEKILMLIGPHNTGALYHSLNQELIKQSGGDIAKIRHFFNYYGVYVDAGVGKGFFHGNHGDIGFTPKRKPKPWLSPKYFGSIHKLVQKMSDLDGEEFAVMMHRIIGGK
jgi:hypothetical protein